MQIPKQLLRRTIPFNFSKQRLTFDANPSLFSSATVDTGTQALLNSLRKNNDLDYSRILDLGCGYGPIAIFLKTQHPKSTIDACDRDALALAFTAHNAAQNNAAVNTIASTGYEHITDTYTLITSNIPAKIGTKAITEFIHGASRHLTPGGQFAFVIVREHEALITTILENEHIHTTFAEKKNTHLIIHCKYSTILPALADQYRKATLHLPTTPPYAIPTVASIPEFNTLSYASLALIKLLKRTPLAGVCAFIEPGQGAGPLLTTTFSTPTTLDIYSRDQLALANTAHALNLSTHRANLHHTAFLDQPVHADYAIVQLFHKNDRALNAYNIAQLRTPNLIIYGPRPAAKDFLDRGKLADCEELRHHGAYLLNI